MNATPTDSNDNHGTTAKESKNASADLKAWIENVAAALKDATTLDVSTFTGTVKGVFTMQDDGFKFEMSKLTAAMNDNSVSLVAHTHVAIDQDQMLFVSEGMASEREKLLLMHASAVKTATDARIAFVDAVAKLLHYPQ